MKKEDLTIIKEGKTGYGILIENDGFIKLNENSSVIKESLNDGEWHCPKPFIVDCLLQRANAKNANGRIYPKNILEREVANYQTLIKERRALGELDHPQDSTISLQKISHNIIECHWEGDAVIGKLELNISEGFRRSGIVSTMGDQAANLLLNGYKIGISSRAVGSVEQKMGVLMVGNDLELLGWDLVSNPSTPEAWLGSEEEVHNYIGGNNMFEKTSKPNKIVNEKINKLKNILNS